MSTRSKKTQNTAEAVNAEVAAVATPAASPAPKPTKRTPKAAKSAPAATASEGNDTAPPAAEEAAPAKATGSKSRSGAAKASTTKARAAKGGAARGRKPAAAKAEDDVFDDADLTDDLDDELIDDEVEAVADDPTDSAAEAAEKAKPLRMKLSKAKERALMKEFGLDDTVLTEEEAKLRREKLKQLIKLGKTRGYLTHAEINDHLPDKLVEQETLEVVVSLLNDMGVAVYDQTPDAETLLLTGAPTAVTTEEEAEEEAEAALSTVDSEFGRTTDPVRMYMREMGTVELLTREGEIEIAKRIERGLHEMMEAISESPAIIHDILVMADEIREGKTIISAVVDGFTDADEADDYVAEEDFDDYEDDDDG